MDPERSLAPSPEQVAVFFEKHRTGLVTLVFTDLVDSSAFLQKLGDQAGATFLRQRRGIIRGTLRAFGDGEEIETAGDSFLLVFPKPSDAVRFALLAQARLRQFSAEVGLPVQERMGIHLGEVVIAEGETAGKVKDLYGIQLTIAARVMSLAEGGQILLTRGVFDSARQVLKGEDIPGIGALSWASHGTYQLKGVEDPVEICELGETERCPLAAPKTSEKAQRQVRPDEEPVLGWRPAVGLEVPNTPWVLEEKLGEGGFGEVWAGRHRKLKERRVFKFCFRADRVRTLKRELTLFRLLKEHVGDHPNIVRLYEVYLDEPPYYLEEEYVDGKDLGSWCRERGGVDQLPLSLKLELVAQAADALQAAHDSGVIHRDVKPGNILVSESGVRSPESGSQLRASNVMVKLTDFGIGQVTSAQVLAGVTRTGFTQTLMGDSTSSKTGTHLYMAPELLSGQPASTRSDIYSLGVILYQLLVGDLTRPLTSDWTDEIEDSLLRDDLRRCCARRPEERFAGVAQLAFSVRHHEQRRRELAERQAAERNALRRQRLTRFASAIAALLLILALALGYGLNEARKQRARAEAGLETARANLYAANVNLAFHAFRENNLGTALDLLNRHVPEPGQRDLRDWEWRYLWRECQSDELCTLGHHSNFVTAVTFSPDGKRLASSARDRTVKVWDLEQGRLVTTLRCDDQKMTIAFSPDGRHLATGVQGGEGGVRLWDTRSWESTGAFGEGTLVTTMAFSPDGRVLATVNGSSGTLWDPSTGRRIGQFPGGDPDEHGIPLDFSRDGRWFTYVDGLEAKNVCLYARKEDRPVATLEGHTGNVTSLALSPDACLLASAGWDRSVRIWDCLRRTQVAVLTNHTAWVSSLAFSPDGKTLVSAGADQRIRLWRTTDWQEIAAMKGHRNEVWALAVSPDGSRIASGSKDCSVRLWKLAPPPPSRGINMRPADTAQLFPATLRGFAILHQDGTLGFVDPRSALEGRRIETPFRPAEVAGGAAAPDEGLVALSLTNNTVCLWDPVLRQTRFRPAPTSERIERPLFSPDGKLLAGITQSGRRLYVWSVSDGQVVNVLTNDLGHLSGMVWPTLAPDGRQLATGHANGEACLWALDAGGGRLRLSGHMGAIFSLAFAPDGELLATTSDDGTLKLWETATGRECCTLRGQLLSLHSVTFSPSGRRVAAGTGNGWIKMWDIETRQEVATIVGPSGFIGMVVFPQGTDTLLAASSSGFLHALYAPTFAEIAAAGKANSGTSRKSP